MVCRLCLLFFCAATVATPGLAQDERGPFFLGVDGLYSYQGGAGLDGGGEMTVQRGFLRVGGLYRTGEGSAGLFVSRGQLAYDFDGAAAPWSDVNDLAISVPLRLSTASGMTYFAAPSLRFDYEDGAGQSDGRTAGAFLGASWRISETLTIGPGLGVFTEIESDDLNVFPALLIDWDIGERFNLSTGPTIGATQGPGLQLSYAYSENTRIGLAGRYESIRFRLDDTGAAPGGVGEDTSFPLVVTFSYAPNPGTGLSAFAGAELGGQLSVEDADGTLIDRRDYEAAPVIGAAFRLAF